MDDFAENKHFQFGTENPTLMEKPFWKYMICNPQLDAFDIRSRVGIFSPLLRTELPVYCYSRFGSTQTYLPDGRLICIGGEHEDGYDPDFQIYNDVVVIQNPQIVEGSDGYAVPIPINFPKEKINKKLTRCSMLGTSNEKDVTIYGYPEDVFPPTDFHTATFVRTKDKEKCIYIIGGTGCKEGENIRVYRLLLSDFSIQHVKTSGSAPRCCGYEHHAELLSVDGRRVIEIRILHLIAERCGLYKVESKDPNEWGNHPQAYRLDIETGVWTISKQ